MSASHPVVNGTDRRRRTAHPEVRRRALAAIVLASVGVAAAQAAAQAPVNLVLDSGNTFGGTPLPSGITGPTVVLRWTNRRVTFNGVTILYLGDQSVAPIVSSGSGGGGVAPAATVDKFVVLGDLNLMAGQKIYGIGSDLIQLDVGNNANFASGSLISVSAEGRQSGAGGGTGGLSPLPPAINRSDDFVNETRGGLGGLTPPNTSINGLTGGTSQGDRYIVDGNTLTSSSLEYQRLFRSVAGAGGQAGAGNSAIAAGGVERVYRRTDGELPIGGDPGIADFVMAAQGAGGRGGAGGSQAAFGNPNGEDGRPGITGGNGNNGLAGADASPIVSNLNPLVVSLRGGNGGGAGATGGSGLPGGNGGGGGGGGANAGGLNNPVGTGLDRLPGGDGGTGGVAGLGGAGGRGGNGGGGGGGIQVLVRGTLTVGSGAAFTANGANGGAGAAGNGGGAGGAGAAGQSFNVNDSRGDGGRGGNGGNGGAGGAGGNGIGGTGGVVQIVASNLTFNGTTSTRGGLAGDGVTRSADGATYIHAYSGSSAGMSTNTYFGARAAGVNPYRSYPGSIPINGAPTNLSPNVPYIDGGASPYGLLADNTSVGRDIKIFTDLVASNGRKRLGVISRVGANFLASTTNNAAFVNDSQDLILFTAFEGALAQPAISVIDPSHRDFLGDVIPAAPVRLRPGTGYRDDPILVVVQRLLDDPNDLPPADYPLTLPDLETLPAYNTFAMYASGQQVVNASIKLYGGRRTFTGTPAPTPFAGVTIPGAGSVFIEDRGVALIGLTATSRLGGPRSGFLQEVEVGGEYANLNGMIPLNLRAGDTGSVAANLESTGNEGTYVNGNVRIRTLTPQLALNESGPLFTQLNTSYRNVAVGQAWNSSEVQIVTNGLAVGTTNRVGEVIFTPDYDDTTRTIVFPISGRVFGPTPRLGGSGVSGNTFTFDAIDAEATASASFNLQNADVLSPLGSVWSNAIRSTPALIRLTVLGFELIDPAGVFSVSGLGRAPFTLNGDQLRAINVGFDPTGVGTYTATLRLLTDMNAPVGQPGDFFTINLVATAVPEPTSLIVMGGAAAMLLRRRS